MPPVPPSPTTPALADLREAVAAEAVRVVRRLGPAGGVGDPVFPPTHVIKDERGRGVTVARSIVSEMVGINARPGKRPPSRIDPARIEPVAVSEAADRSAIALLRAALCPAPVPGRGRLAELEGRFARGQRPSPGGTASDAAPRDHRGPAIAPGDWIAFERVSGPVIPLRAAAGVAAAVRAALIQRAADPVPASICGHEADGTPTRGPRVAILPLPHVGHAHATGELMGFALLLPPDLPAADRGALHRALETVDEDGVVDEFHRLALGPPGRWTIARRPDPALTTLRRDRWEGPARRWASVTPVLLDRVPKPKPGRDLAAVVAASCRFAGLPEPVAVERVPDPPVPAVPRAGAFLLDTRRERPVRVCTHLVLAFAEKVAGPLVIGAGRHRGLGLFAPLPEEFP